MQKNITGIRIFLSSTFADMGEERAYIIRSLYPEMEKLCLQRGLSLYFDDLRWGCDEDDLNNMGAVSYCLREIDDCRPFFIGLVGSRYGWIPQLDEALKAQFPTLANRDGLSMTELEFWYHALSGAERGDAAMRCFCLKNGEGVAQSDDPEKMAAFRRAVLESGSPVLEEYSTLEEMGSFLYGCFSRWLSANLPIQDLEKQRQLAYQNTVGARASQNSAHRLLRDVPDWDAAMRFQNTDITGEGIEWAAHHLSRFATGGKVLMLTLPQTMSRTDADYILSNCRVELGYSYPDMKYIFVNPLASPSMVSWKSIVNHILLRLKQEHQVEIPDYAPTAVLTECDEKTGVEMLQSFYRVMRDAQPSRPVLIVLENLDLLRTADGSNSLFWLPLQLSDKLSIIGTAKDAGTFELFRAGKTCLCRNFPVPSNNNTHVNQLLGILERYGKLTGLRKDQLTMIRDAPLTAGDSPIALIGNYLGLYALPENIDSMIETIFGTDRPLELSLLRLQCRDAGPRTAQLLRNALGILCVMKNGLTEQLLYDTLCALLPLSKLELRGVLEQITPFLEKNWERYAISPYLNRRTLLDALDLGETFPARLAGALTDRVLANFHDLPAQALLDDLLELCLEWDCDDSLKQLLTPERVLEHLENHNQTLRNDCFAHLVKKDPNALGRLYGFMLDSNYSRNYRVLDVLMSVESLGSPYRSIEYRMDIPTFYTLDYIHSLKDFCHRAFYRLTDTYLEAPPVSLADQMTLLSSIRYGFDHDTLNRTEYILLLHLFAFPRLGDHFRDAALQPYVQSLIGCAAMALHPSLTLYALRWYRKYFGDR